MPKILLVEDEQILREAYTVLLTAHGYDMDVASNGAEALQLCTKNTYDVILLDLMMPVMDGTTFLKKAGLPKKAPQTRIVLLSNLSSGEDVTEALSLGAQRHEVKSDLSPSQMIALIEQELQLSQQ